MVDQGTLRRRQLVRCGITEDDLFSELRRQGTYTLKEVRYVLYEPKGGLTIVAEGAHLDGAEVLDRGLHAAPEPAPAVESGD